MRRSVKGKGKYYVHVPPQPTNYRQKSGGGPGGGRGVSGGASESERGGVGAGERTEPLSESYYNFWKVGTNLAYVGRGQNDYWMHGESDRNLSTVHGIRTCWAIEFSPGAVTM